VASPGEIPHIWPDVALAAKRLFRLFSDYSDPVQRHPEDALADSEAEKGKQPDNGKL
jgi:hypothetical protein